MKAIVDQPSPDRQVPVTDVVQQSWELHRIGETGVTTEPFEFTHGPSDGYITFHRIVRSGKNEQFQNIAAIRADTIGDFLPEIREHLTIDSYQSIQTFYRPGSDRDRSFCDPVFKMLPIARRKTNEVRHLTNCWVELDCYRAAIEPGTAMGEVWNAATRNEVPIPSAFLLSGRGVWVFWRLRHRLEPMALPNGFGPERALGKQINQALVNRFRHLGADPVAVDMARIRRVIGSVNSKSGERVILLPV